MFAEFKAALDQSVSWCRGSAPPVKASMPPGGKTLLLLVLVFVVLSFVVLFVVLPAEDIARIACCGFR